jgi:hypothetical protein
LIKELSEQKLAATVAVVMALLLTWAVHENAPSGTQMMYTLHALEEKGKLQALSPEKAMKAFGRTCEIGWALDEQTDKQWIAQLNYARDPYGKEDHGLRLSVFFDHAGRCIGYKSQPK